MVSETCCRRNLKVPCQQEEIGASMQLCSQFEACHLL
jgi:hypothetical protein